MRVVILVPRRDGFADRDRIWAWCKAWWSERYPDWPIVEGHHEANEGALFNRSLAVNRAARLAGDDWDVAVIIDADVICDVDRTRQAVRMAHDAGRLTLPYDIRKDLNAKGSEHVMAGFDGSWERWVEVKYRNQVSSVIAVPRSLWLEVEGFDEKFLGWGGEDQAFAIACETFGGPMLRIEGDLWELKHAAAPEGRRGTPSHTANYARKRRYDAVAGNQEAIRQLRHEHMAFTDPGRGIPRIIHRVVPEETTDQVEGWWDRFRELHPGWELRTWRDPIDPRPFPLTGPHWSLARHGAQLADLIRLEVLWNEGGIYVDSDVEPLRPMDALLPLAGFAGWEDEHRVPNAVIGAVPGHPAIRECIDLAVERLLAGEQDIPTATGPGVLTEVLPWRADFLLLPPGSLYPVHYRQAREREGTDHGARQPWAFVSHHWHGSWLPARKRWNSAA